MDKLLNRSIKKASRAMVRNSPQPKTDREEVLECVRQDLSRNTVFGFLRSFDTGGEILLNSDLAPSSNSATTDVLAHLPLG